jgi:hypothetical protein
VGVTQIMLDRHSLLPMLGVAAELNSLLSVQVLESGAFHNLGTIISVTSNASYGTSVLQMRVQTDKEESRSEIRQGSIGIVPLAVGQTARLSLHPLHRADIGAGPGRAQVITVSGGALGVVIDARGRPVQLPSDAVRRRELYKKWLWTLGG